MAFRSMPSVSTSGSATCPRSDACALHAHAAPLKGKGKGNGWIRIWYSTYECGLRARVVAVPAVSAECFARLELLRCVVWALCMHARMGCLEIAG